MSGSEKSDQENSFLARWSQRKQEAKQLEPNQDVAAIDNAEAVEVAAAQPQDAEPEFDPSTLPKLEELTGTTDITSFLRKGVPEHLRNAALRKSWALDPAVRNYVNPALEYAYDWNTPGGVPGSSELGAAVDIARLVSQIMGDGPPAAPSDSSEKLVSELDGVPLSSVHPDSSPPPPRDLPVQSMRRGQDADCAEFDHPGTGQGAESAAQNPAASQQSVRRHGTAKPIV
jgi:hypothetical protein